MDQRVIAEELRRLRGNISKAARVLDVDYQELKAQFGSADAMRVRTAIGPIPYDIRELGRPGLRQYVIAVKSAHSPEWPLVFSHAINLARKRYDAGTHIVCQNTREDGWVVLYSIPRKTPVRPRNFFHEHSAT